MKKTVFIAIFAISWLFSAAQARWQADVSVTSVTLANATITRQPPILKNPNIPNPTNTSTTTPPASANLKCTITVHNENDDDANGTTLVVVLPVEVTLVSMSPGGTAHTGSTGSSFTAYISFDLGHMTVGQNNTVELIFSKSKYGNKVGAFAFSGSPDPNPTNNYKEATF